MLYMKGKYMEQLRDKVYPIEKLCRSVQAPVEQFYQSRHAIRFKHIVPVFTKSTEGIKDLNHKLESTAQMLELIFVTDRDTLTDLNKDRDKLKLSHEVKVSLLPHIQNLLDFFQRTFKSFIIFDDWNDLFF